MVLARIKHLEQMAKIVLMDLVTLMIIAKGKDLIQMQMAVILEQIVDLHQILAFIEDRVLILKNPRPTDSVRHRIAAHKAHRVAAMVVVFREALLASKTQSAAIDKTHRRTEPTLIETVLQPVR